MATQKSIFNIFGSNQNKEKNSAPSKTIAVVPLFSSGGNPAFMVRLVNVMDFDISISELRGQTELILDGKWWHWLPRKLPDDFKISPGETISWQIGLNDLFVKLDDRFVGLDNTALPRIDEPAQLPKLSDGFHSVQFRVALVRSEPLGFYWQQR